MTLEVAQDELAEVLNRVPDTPFLFDTGKGRLLVRSRTKVVAMRCPAKVARFLERRGVGEGLGITVRTAGLECAVVAAGAVSVDDLATGAQLTEDVAFMHEQATVNRLTQETAAARTRLAVARDLHDSVAQLLAGISFRLEALKRSRKPAAELSRELETLQRELTTEQEQVRSLIAELRQPAEAPFAGNLPSRLGDLTDRLARQWGIDCAFEHDGKVPSEVSFDKELQQMVREGVANAVRHGRADRVAIRLRAALGGYELLIADNGHGWPNGKDGAGLATPRSLHERAEALGGSLEAGQDRNGATVRILLPAEAAR